MRDFGQSHLVLHGPFCPGDGVRVPESKTNGFICFVDLFRHHLKAETLDVLFIIGYMSQ